MFIIPIELRAVQSAEAFFLDRFRMTTEIDGQKIVWSRFRDGTHSALWEARGSKMVKMIECTYEEALLQVASRKPVK